MMQSPIIALRVTRLFELREKVTIQPSGDNLLCLGHLRGLRDARAWLAYTPS
jgi:hypothetical protein